MKNDFECKKYELFTEKGAPGRKLRFLLVADLHGHLHGKNNAGLIAESARLKPDLILCAGDMVIGRAGSNFDDVLHVYEALRRLAPVYTVNGNHESRLRRFPHTYHCYLRELRAKGVVPVNNKTVEASAKGEPLLITGVELSLKKYRKFHLPHLEMSELQHLIGSRDTADPRYHILLAHNPQFAETYFSWGADLTVSGHFHGGVMRLGENQVAASPYGFPLPKYGYGQYRSGQKNLIVSAGLGEHTIPFRINNPMELVYIDVTFGAGAPGA